MIKEICKVQFSNKIPLSTYKTFDILHFFKAEQELILQVKTGGFTHDDDIQACETVV